MAEKEEREQVKWWDPELQYGLIMGWHTYYSSSAWYIRDQILLAKIENAPGDAIYRKSPDGPWFCYSELDPRTDFHIYVESLRKADRGS